MLTVIIVTVLWRRFAPFSCLGVLSSIALGLIIRLAVYGVDACLRYGRNRDSQFNLLAGLSTQVGIEVNHRFLRRHHCGHSPRLLHPHWDQRRLHHLDSDIQIATMEGVSVDECCSICLEPFKSSSNLVVWVRSVLCVETQCLQACLSRQVYRWVVAVVPFHSLFP